MFIARLIALVGTFILLLCSCGQSNSRYATEKAGKRDMIEMVTVSSLDEKIPEIHAFSYIKILGDTLIIHDPVSTGQQFIAYDLSHDKYIGSFGSTGNGPGEINNFGSIFFDPDNRILYGVDGNKWQISAFNIDSALTVPHYKASKKVDLDSSNGRFPINYANYINDSTIICSVYLPDKDNTHLSTRLGVLDLITGKTYVIDDILPDEKVRSSVTVSQHDNMIITADRTHDRIRLFDMNGLLIKTIYGPDFIERHDGRKSYYSFPVVADNRIYAVYSGKDLLEQRCGNDIIVMDTDGHYLKTLRINQQIVSMDFHEKTGRIYMSLEGDSQFGYIQPPATNIIE